MIHAWPPRRSVAFPTCLLAILLGVWLVWRPPSPDLAAQVYRVHLFAVNGFSLWDNNWYAGHYLPGYSLLFPALAYLCGLRAVGVVAVTLSTLFFRGLIAQRAGSRVGIATTLFALGAAGDLYIGRVAFALGVTLGLGSVLALVRGHRISCGLLSLACSAASPVAAAFLVLVALADLTTYRKPTRAAVLGLPAVTLTAALTVLLPQSGYEPFALVSLLAAAAASLALIVMLAPRERLLRRGAQLYLAALLVSYVVPSPMGSNSVRFGVLFAAPALAGCVDISDVQRTLARWSSWRPLAGHGQTALASAMTQRLAVGAVRVLLVALALWQVDGPLAQSAGASLDPASRYAFYVPVIRYLDSGLGRSPTRIEVPFDSSHWDVAILGERFDLARGWERQLDTGYDALFYAPRLTAREYHGWLLTNAVRYVVVPNTSMDSSSQREVALINGGLPFLREVFHSANWRVYAVVSAQPLASGPGRLVAMDGDGFTLSAAHAGTFVVRIHFTSYWRVTSGAAIITETPGGWTRVMVVRRGNVAIDAEFFVSL
jgi:hypothetical protein